MQRHRRIQSKSISLQGKDFNWASFWWEAVPASELPPERCGEMKSWGPANTSHILCLGTEPQLGMTQTRNSPVTTFSWTSSSPLLSSIKSPKGWANASMMILLPGSKKEAHLEVVSKNRDNPAAAGQRTHTTTTELLDSTLHCQVSRCSQCVWSFCYHNCQTFFLKEKRERSWRDQEFWTEETSEQEYKCREWVVQLLT